MIGTKQDDGPPDVVFYIAKQQGRGWKAAIEADKAAFSQLVKQAPAGFVPDVFLPAPAGVGAQAWTKLSDLELMMPFRLGETWRLLGGPHAGFGAETLNSIDIAPESNGGANGAVYPAYDGFATTPCKIIESDGGPLVVVRHMDGWETRYFHLIDTVPMKKSVTINNRLGTTSARSDGGNCTGTATGPHVHFSLHKNGRPEASNYPITGLWLGGYQIKAGANAYDCTLTKKIYYSGVGATTTIVNRNGAFYNNGERGLGSYIKVTNLVVGKKGELLFGRMPPHADINVTMVYSPPAGGDQITKTIKTIRTNGGGGHRVVKFTVPKTRGGVIEFYAERLPGGAPGDLVYSVSRTAGKK